MQKINFSFSWTNDEIDFGAYRVGDFLQIFFLEDFWSSSHNIWLSTAKTCCVFDSIAV